MGCVLILALLGLPRLGLLWLWFFEHGYVVAATDSRLWSVLGFVFLPTTTLAFAYGMNGLGAPGEMTPLGWLLTLIGLVFDIGLHGRGGWGARRWQVDEPRDREGR